MLAINLESGSTLTINGGSNSIDGGDATRGLFVYSGTVTVNDLTIADAVAVRGAGHSGGGGGAGLGGGLFVASAGNVTLNDVAFTGDSATGGAGGGVKAEVGAVAAGWQATRAVAAVGLAALLWAEAPLPGQGLSPELLQAAL